MLKIIFYFGCAFALSAIACTANSGKQTEAAKQETSAAADSSKHFGAVITTEGAMTYDQLMNQMTTSGLDSMPAKVTARVSEVCQVKGCWMTLVSDQPDQPSMRVTFKDYAFFVPKDLSGKQVVIDGFALVEEISVDDQRHYAEDAGKSAEEIAAITQPKRELTFEANGVVIVD